MKNSQNKIFHETYLIKATYQREDTGFWDFIEESQPVALLDLNTEKNNHRKAEELFLTKYNYLKNLQVLRVIYE